MPIFEWDATRPVPKKLAASLTKRLSRLEAMHQSDAVTMARRAFAAIAPERTYLGELRLRHGFAYLEDPSSSPGLSDRSAPPREQRPPATRVSNSRGVALRLELLALAAAQSRYRAGSRPKNERGLKPFSTTSQDGWVDLLATPTTRSGSGRHSSGVLDKKLRQVQTALTTLEAAGLVELPNRNRVANIFEGFELLNEVGPRLTGPPVPYDVPRQHERVFALPAAFITQGWIHVLEDSEIALLLMVASGQGGLPNQGGKIAVPADVRLLHYGISRGAYGDAHVVLNKLGLLEVEEVGRNEAGQAIDYAEEGAELHRLLVTRDGFAVEAVPQTIKTLQYERDRVA